MAKKKCKKCGREYNPNMGGISGSQEAALKSGFCSADCKNSYKK